MLFNIYKVNPFTLFTQKRNLMLKILLKLSIEYKIITGNNKFLTKYLEINNNWTIHQIHVFILLVIFALIDINPEWNS